MNEIVSLREAIQEDWELMMAWRSHPDVFKRKYTQVRPLTWLEHYTFMTTRGRWWKFFIILLTDNETTRKVGVLNFGQLDDHNPQFNSYIGETTLNNPQVEEDAIQLGMDWLTSKGYIKTHVVIRDDNTEWADIVTRLEFNKIGPARPGESTWEKYLIEQSTSNEYTSGRRNL